MKLEADLFMFLLLCWILVTYFSARDSYSIRVYKFLWWWAQRCEVTPGWFVSSSHKNECLKSSNFSFHRHLNKSVILVYWLWSMRKFLRTLYYLDYYIFIFCVFSLLIAYRGIIKTPNMNICYICILMISHEMCIGLWH